MADRRITIDNQDHLNPDPLPCDPRDTITWYNQSRGPVTIYLPACVSPQDGPVPIPVGGHSNAYTVIHEHKYKVETSRNGPSGTIDVS